MIEFRRVQIDKALVKRLGDLLWKGASIVLLGPRHIGKRYVARRLREHLADHGQTRLATVAFIGRRSEGFDEAGAGDGGAAVGLLPPDFETVLEWVDARLAEGPGRVTLIATNLDARPDGEIREFLYALRSRIEGHGPGAGPLSVALTGEMELSRFTYGPQSALTCNHQFLIQGFAPEEFRAYARRFLDVLGHSDVQLGTEDIERLRERIGGNVYFFRLLLWSALDRVAQRGGEPSELFKSGLAADDYQLSKYYFRYISHLIDANPPCWSDLERLVAAEGERVHRPDPTPHPLELAGVAVQDRGFLKLSNPLMGDFVRRHYTPRRFADLHAREGDWPGAFERYRRVEPALRLRPTDLEDQGDAEMAVKYLRTSLFRAVTVEDGHAYILRQFCEGCRYVLGLGEVTRWRHIREWAPMVEDPFDRPAEGDGHLDLLDGIPAEGPPGRVRLDDELSYRVVAVRIPTDHPDVHEVVLVGHPGRRNILSTGRERMIHSLVDDFVSAYGHALQDLLHHRRRQFQRDFAQFDGDITARLGSEIFGVQGVLKEAAKRLRNLGYSRVVFAVLDPAGRKVIPVAMAYDREVYGEVEEDFLPVPLEGDRRSASRWVVKHKEPMILADATTDDRVRTEVAVKHRIRGAAVVPMLNPVGEVAGTIQIEHADGLRPTDVEVKDLLDFGRKVAVALALIEQVAMLQNALGALREPVAMFGHDGRVRFMNRWAAAPVGLEPKWYRGGQGPRYDELHPDGLAAGNLAPFVELVGVTLRSARSMFRPTPAEYQGRTVYFATRTEPLWDWRKHLKGGLDVPGEDVAPGDGDRSERELLAGVLMHARDETVLRLTFQALEVLLERAGRSDEVVRRTIRATEVLGHRWARLYKVDRDNPWCLVSADGYGFADEALARRFRDGTFRLEDPRDGRLWAPWYCFEARRPVVLRHDPVGADGEPAWTETGLEARNCRLTGAAEEFRKQPGELWIDFPLQVDATRIGKLTLECRETLRPEHLEFLDLLCKLTSALLRASIENEKDLGARAMDYERTAERVLHEAIHNIFDFFGELSTAMSRLWMSADDLLVAVSREARPGIVAAPAAQHFAEARARVQEVYTRIYSEIEGRMRRELDEPFKTLRTDLYALLSNLAAGRVEGVEIRIGPPGRPDEIVADLDAGRVLRSLERLVRAAARSPRTGAPARVSVSAALLPRAEGEWVAITVAEDGPGSPKGNRTRPARRSGDAKRPPDAEDEGWLDEVQAMAGAHGGSARSAGVGGRFGFVIEFPRLRVGDGRPAEAEPLLARRSTP